MTTYGLRKVLEDIQSDLVYQGHGAAGSSGCDGCENYRKITDAIATLDGMALVPVEPSEGRLMSMAIRSDHGLGVPGHYDHPLWLGAGTDISHADRLQSAIRLMRQLYEEATGQGFYSPEREEEYKAMLAAHAGGEEGK